MAHSGELGAPHSRRRGSSISLLAMTTSRPGDTAYADAPAALLGVPITPPSPELLVAVESALAEVPVADDDGPSPAAAG